MNPKLTRILLVATNIQEISIILVVIIIRPTLHNDMPLTIWRNQNVLLLWKLSLKKLFILVLFNYEKRKVWSTLSITCFKSYRMWFCSYFVSPSTTSTTNQYHCRCFHHWYTHFLARTFRYVQFRQLMSTSLWSSCWTMMYSHCQEINQLCCYL